MPRRTVVCVHGLTRNSRDFDFLAQRFARARRASRRARSARTRSQRPVAHAEDYGDPALSRAMAAPSSRASDVNEVDWIGTSLGGHIGMELAARPGTPIRRLVLNDFGARVPALRRCSASASYLRLPGRFRIDEWKSRRTCATSTRRSAP